MLEGAIFGVGWVMTVAGGVLMGMAIERARQDRDRIRDRWSRVR